MGYNLFLDDVRSPMCLGLLISWETVKNYNAFVNIITDKGLPDFISFDHDLCWEDIDKDPFSESFVEKTGMDCAKWLVEYCTKNKLSLPKWQVHSLNVDGKKNIISLLKSYEKSTQTK